MNVRCTHEVLAGVQGTWLALTSEAWPAALDARLHDGSELIQRSELPGGGLRIVSRRRLPDGGPPFLRRLEPADGTVVQTDTWGAERDGVRSGTWKVAFAGAPASIGGHARVEPAGEGARWVVEGAVTVRVPLVGGRAEAYLAPLVEKLVATQAEVLRGLL